MTFNAHRHDQLPAGHTLDECLRAAILPAAVDDNYLAHTAEPQTDAEWLYGNSPAGLRMRAAEELAAEFGTDVEEWLV